MASGTDGNHTEHPSDERDDSTRVRLIERSFDILEAIADSPRTLSEVCKETGLSKGTAFRLLAGLRHRTIVLKDPVSQRYALGPGLLGLVSGAVSGLAASASIAAMGRAPLEALAAHTRETVALHVRSGLGRVCIFEVPGPQPIRYSSTVGSYAPLAVGAGGKVLLAFQSDEERERLIPLLSQGADLPDLSETIDRVRERGYAISVAERVEGASAIAVPIHLPQIVMSLSVLGPTSRLPDEVLITSLDAMHATAAEISEEVSRANM